MMRTAAKLVIVNLLVATALLVLLELGYRAVKFAGSCAAAECESGYWVLENKFNKARDVGFTKPDDTLGYVPRDGEYLIHPSQPERFEVTIRQGVRASGRDKPYRHAHVTLAVGDSFTFGDEVSDGETWPACLEWEWNARVVNGGVFGYGAAQAVLRARELERQSRFDRIIWSILLEHDFERDGLVARSNVLRPAVVGDDGRVHFGSIEESQRILDRTTRDGIARHAHLFGYSYLTKLAWERLSPLMLPAGTRYDGRWNVAHPSAASAPQIMRFAFDEFAALSATEKYVLVQYAKPTLAALSAKAGDELQWIRKLAAERGIPVIDTRAVLKEEAGRAELYRVHHTPAGNRAVCRSILTALAVKVPAGPSRPRQSLASERVTAR